MRTTPDHSLHDCRILVVEDEYMLAEDLTQELLYAGAQVIGPAPTMEAALKLIEPDLPPDGAVLDVNLGGEPVFPLADALIARGVPLVFTTGYDPATLPERFAHVPTCGKPVSTLQVTQAIRGAIHS